MRILIVDDEESIVDSLVGIMSDEGYESVSAFSGEQALEIVEAQHIDAVLMDIWMPGIDGLETLTRMKAVRPHLPVIMISGHGNIDTAVQATKIGAFDFIEKPPSYDKIVLSINNALRLSRVEKENLILRDKAIHKPELTGQSPEILALKEQINRVAPSDAWVLIQGEHGTGKELVAQAIHRSSGRKDHELIDINCAAIPEELIESELFGHEKGSFTGAISGKRGKFDLANGSTLFLDEIADMSLKTQAKILRILQEQKFERVGGSKTISVDVRVLAATNKDLEREIELGHFREDLYWRLNVVPIYVPPLRERISDLPLFVSEFANLFAAKGLGRKEFTSESLELMATHLWPGNVRELRNFLERLMIMTPEPLVTVETVAMLLPNLVVPKKDMGVACLVGSEVDVNDACSIDWKSYFTQMYGKMNYKEARVEFERNFLQLKLESNGGNISKTAEQIGMERSHLHKKMKSLDVRG